MKDCFEPHVLMHALFGLGLGILITHFFPMLAIGYLGGGLMAAAIVLDMMRKS